MDKVICTNCGAENSTINRYCINCGFELPKLTVPFAESAPAEEATLTAKLNRHKGLIGAVFGTFLFVLIVYGVMHLFSGKSFLDGIRNSVMDKAMTAMANEMNKKCPLNIDQYTRLDKVKALPDKTFEYDFTLIGISKSQVNPDLLKANVEQGIVDNVKTNAEMESFRKNKATLIYSYNDNNGENILKITITPDMYEE